MSWATFVRAPISALGRAVQNGVAILNPSSVGYGVLTLAVALAGSIYQIKSYYQASVDNPRNVLASRGIQWGQQAFFEAIQTGDLETTRLFLDGKMSPRIRGDDRQLSMFLAMNNSNPVAMLDLLMKYPGFDINYSYPARHAVGPQSAPIILFAVLNENERLVKALIQRGADVNVHVEVAGFGAGSETPLSLARVQGSGPRATVAARRILKMLQDGGAL